jgi:hypothetical protein
MQLTRRGERGTRDLSAIVDRLRCAVVATDQRAEVDGLVVTPDDGVCVLDRGSADADEVAALVDVDAVAVVVTGQGTEIDPAAVAPERGVLIGALRRAARSRDFSAIVDRPRVTESLFTGDVVSARMASGPGGNGRMILSAGSGIPMVEAGYADGLGVVRTGPAMGGAPSSLVGLPYAILGKKGTN